MAKRFPLQTLLDLSQEQLDEAAKRLHALKARWQEAEDKLRQLQGFRAEYQERFRQAGEGGMSVTAWRDYQLFLGKLDHAVEQQQQDVALRMAEWERGKQDWLVERRKLKAYQTLESRHIQRESAKESRREQKVQDESAGHLHRRGRHSGEDGG